MKEFEISAEFRQIFVCQKNHLFLQLADITILSRLVLRNFYNIHIISWMQFSQNVCLFFGGYVDIDLGGFNRRMTQELLYAAYVDAFLYQVCCKGMAKHMGCDFSLYSCL